MRSIVKFISLAHFVSFTIASPLSLDGLVFDLRIDNGYSTGFPVRRLDGSLDFIYTSLEGRRPFCNLREGVSDAHHFVDITGQLIPVNIRRPYWDEQIQLVRGDDFGYISLTDREGSLAQYSSLFLSLSPRSTVSSMRLQLAVSPTDGGNEYCRDGAMAAYAPFLYNDRLKLRAQVSLVDSSSEFEGAQVIGGAVSEPGEYMLSINMDISVPPDIKNLMEREMHANLNLTWPEFERHPDCGSMINHLPTIKYTILDSSDSSPAAEVHIEPSDYVWVFTHRAAPGCRIRITTNHGPREKFW